MSWPVVVWAASGGVPDRGDYVLQIGVVEAGEGVLEVDGDAVGEGGGQAQDPVLAAAAGELAAVEGGDGFGPADGGHRGAVGDAGEGGDVLGGEAGPGQPVAVADEQV